MPPKIPVSILWISVILQTSPRNENLYPNLEKVPPPPGSNFTYLNWAHFSSPPELLRMQFNTRSRRADTLRRRLSCSMHQGTRPASDDTDPIVLRCALDDLFDNAWDVGTTELDVEWTSRRRRDHGDSILQFLVWSVVRRHRKRGW